MNSCQLLVADPGFPVGRRGCKPCGVASTSDAATFCKICMKQRNQDPWGACSLCPLDLPMVMIMTIGQKEFNTKA